ncbi:hypothetical protein PSAC2689_40225 [Paraburkholderia sacchari]
MPCLASTSVMMASSRNSPAISLSMKNVCATGPGFARPVVSITTRSKSSLPSRFCWARSPSTRARSPRIVQQMQPLLIWMICSWLSCTRISLSMFSSPNSFSITAIFMPCCSFRMRLSRVVLPLPRKPVRMVTGIMLFALNAWNRGGMRRRSRALQHNAVLEHIWPARACAGLALRGKSCESGSCAWIVEAVYLVNSDYLNLIDCLIDSHLCNRSLSLEIVLVFQSGKPRLIQPPTAIANEANEETLRF